MQNQHVNSIPCKRQWICSIEELSYVFSEPSQEKKYYDPVVKSVSEERTTEDPVGSDDSSHTAGYYHRHPAAALVDRLLELTKSRKGNLCDYRRVV